MDDLGLAEVGESGERFEGEFVAKGDLVVDILENVVGDLVLGDADEVVLALEAALLADPNGLVLVRPDVRELGETLEAHLPALGLVLAQLLRQRLLQICIIPAKDAFFVLAPRRLEVQRLHHVAAQAVHHRQPLGEQDEQHAADEHQAQHDLVLDADALDGLLEGVLDEEGGQQLEGDHEGAADQDDELQLVDPLYHLVHARLHHDARHLEVQVEEGYQEGDHDQQVQAQSDPVQHPVPQFVYVEDYQQNQQTHRRHYLHRLQNHPDVLRLLLSARKGTLVSVSCRADRLSLK